jgi:hypothetical protein
VIALRAISEVEVVMSDTRWPVPESDMITVLQDQLLAARGVVAHLDKENARLRDALKLRAALSESTTEPQRATSPG